MTNKQYLPLGHHILADFYNCDPKRWMMWNKSEHSCTRRRHMQGRPLCRRTSTNMRPFVGVSGVVVIQESHLTIHTWPECGYAAVDLFTCGTNVRPWTAFDYLQERLGCAKKLNTVI